MTNPIFDYAQGECGSITGGAFVPDGVWPAEFDDDYLYADFNCNRIFRLRPQSGGGGGFVSSAFASNLGGGGPVTLRFLEPLPGGAGGSVGALYYTTYARGGELRRIRSTQGGGNQRPTARLDADPLEGLAPLAVHFDGSASSDPEGGPLSFRWNFGDGSPETTTGSSGIDHTYPADGEYEASLRVEDDHDSVSVPAAVTVRVGNQPPVVTWLRPAAGFRFSAGQSFLVRFAATDPEDGPLPASRVSLRAVLHHDEHLHPFLPATATLRLQVTAPQPEDLLAAETNSLEFIVEATDSAGSTTELRREIEPRRVTLTLRTDPPGLRVTANDVSFTGPSSVTSWPAYRVTLRAPNQRRAGVRWVFQSWSDGGAATHEIVTPKKNVEYTARFRRD